MVAIFCIGREGYGLRTCLKTLAGLWRPPRGARRAATTCRCHRASAAPSRHVGHHGSGATASPSVLRQVLRRCKYAPGYDSALHPCRMEEKDGVMTRTPARKPLAGLVLAGATAVALLGAVQAQASTTAQVTAGTLQVKGDNAANTIALVGQGPTLVVDVGADGTPDFSFDRSTFTSIAVDGAGGDDDLRAQSSVTEHVTLNGGNGDDTLIGGSGADTLVGDPGRDFADGNIGADVAQLGDGNDRFQWDPGDGSDTVDGQGGVDALDFNGSNAGEHIDVTANGARDRLSRDV